MSEYNYPVIQLFPTFFHAANYPKAIDATLTVSDGVMRVVHLNEYPLPPLFRKTFEGEIIPWDGQPIKPYHQFLVQRRPEAPGTLLVLATVEPWLGIVFTKDIFDPDAVSFALHLGYTVEDALQEFKEKNPEGTVLYITRTIDATRALEEYNNLPEDHDFAVFASPEKLHSINLE